jgi:adenosylcobinamide kinase / adenosylcobinamide-phosphate guanylyltransferase
MNAAPCKTLILGGVRSGKSRYAAELAGSRPVTLIATGTAQDAEMAARIELHRKNRPPHWVVVEEPLRLAATLDAAARPGSVIIVDCLTLWLSNLLGLEDETTLRLECASLFETLPALGTDCIFVSNEVGLGIIPMNALARRFGDEAGVLHQRLAALCERVVLMAAGLPLALKTSEAR